MTTAQYTPEVRAKLENYLATHELPKGLGNEESACSIAAINLALNGRLTDNIPDCMSKVLGKTIIHLQDAMPHEMRNSDRYKAWLPTAAGTGCDYEQERLDILMDWMWGTALPQLQGLADGKCFGEEWRSMCEDRTAAAADSAALAAALAANDAAADAAVDAARTAADSAALAADSAALAADNAALAADSAALAARFAADKDFWKEVDPIGVLERMTNLKGDTE